MRATGVIGICLTALVLVYSARSEAASVTDQWKYIGANEKGERFFYDESSVLLVSHDVRQVWIKELSEYPERRLVEINCSFKIIRDMQVISEGKKKVPLPPAGRKDWRAVEQNPTTKELHKILCR